MIKTLEWKGGRLKILDQTQLPSRVVYVNSRNFKDTAEAIRKMKVRGAPALGVAAAFGLAQVVASSRATKIDQLSREVEKAAVVLRATRPTAVNLGWGLDRMTRALETYRDRRLPKLKELMIAEAMKIQKDDVAINEAIGKAGAELIREGDRVLTHCNTGALATAGHGTALGVIRSAWQEKKKISVWVDETRPYLQGARLTTFELKEARIPHTLITDNTAAALMGRKQVDVVLVGADRITASGDVANKIGTYGLAVLAYENKIPFYVAAPLSTLDMNLESGDEIPIEERPSEEVTSLAGRPIAPKGTRALHLGFDVTPHRYISALITEAGVVRAPFKENLRALLASQGRRTPIPA
jgi:methylthioribose-1-phosphate isomerase